MTKSVPIEEAVGLPLAHDITEVRPGEFKGPAFRKGYILRREDLDHLRRLGKEHLFVLDLGEDDLHEDQAVAIMAPALCGPNAQPEGEPREGKLKIFAQTDGLLKINVEALLEFNLLTEVMCATRHTDTVVKRGQELGGTRAIPLIVKRALVEEAARIAREAGGIIAVRELVHRRVGVVITGNEVYHGIIQDRFEPIIRHKVADLGSEVIEVRFAPDDTDIIADAITSLIRNGAEVIVTTGGMSVDPDDVTRAGIAKAGADAIHYGAPVLPGAMFLCAYIGAIPVVGVPACGLHYKATVFDLFLPRVLAGEIITRREIAAMGHGGLCLGCPECRFPDCSFGKGGWVSSL